MDYWHIENVSLWDVTLSLYSNPAGFFHKLSVGVFKPACRPDNLSYSPMRTSVYIDLTFLCC